MSVISIKDRLTPNIRLGSKENSMNPFPGLRPFRLEETHVFFGREGQVDEILEKLEENRLVAILGSSGSGKSSLMYCGVIPSLYGGSMFKAGSNWRVIITRPGISPIENMVKELAKQDLNTPSDKEKQRILEEHKLATLRSSSLGFIEILKKIRREKDENILLLVDQFEEIFRFKDSSTDSDMENESSAFVKMLLEAVRQSEIPVYVIMTMRSDYIGDCAQFPQLTSLINESHYLVPQMTRSQKKRAILGPVAVGRAEISPHLVQRILNDLGNSADQLPIMQHALMRTWDYWSKNTDRSNSIDVIHYETIGGITEALSQHADEAYNELDKEQKEICAFLFKSITQRGSDGRGIRRPTRLSHIAEIANTTPDNLIKVIETFRQSGRTFLMPPYGNELQENSIIDISHESLMRVWARCREWVEEESASARIYLKLCENSAEYQKGDIGLWRPPELHVAENWEKIQKPNLTWAHRYHPGFNMAIQFFQASKEAYSEEQLNKERENKRKLRRIKIFGTAMAGFVIAALVMVFVFYIQQKEAEKQRNIAEEQKKLAETNAQLAKEQSEIAKKNEEEAKQHQLIAEEKRKEAEAARIAAEKAQAEAIKQQNLAEVNAEEARKQEEIARLNAQEALKQENLAKSNAEKAKENAVKAEKEANRADKLRYLSVAQAMAVKSSQIKDMTQRVLVARQAFLFNQRYQGDKRNADIYEGIYYAKKLLDGNNFNVLQGHNDAVRALQFNSTGEYLYSAGADGQIIRWNFTSSEKKSEQIFQMSNIIRSIAISSDEKFLFIANDKGKVDVRNLGDKVAESKEKSRQKKVPKRRRTRQGVWSMVLSPEDNTLYTCGEDGRIKKWTLTQKQNGLQSTSITRRPRSSAPKPKTILLDPDKKSIIVAYENGDITSQPIDGSERKILFSESDNAGTALAFDNNKTRLFAGFQSGKIIVWNMKENAFITDLEGHNASISQICFSKDDSLMATSSFDHTVRVWNLNKLNNQPIVLNDHDIWVASIAFSPDSKYIISGTTEKVIRYFPLDIEMMANGICGNSRLESNQLSERHWERYVGQDIPLETAICP